MSQPSALKLFAIAAALILGACSGAPTGSETPSAAPPSAVPLVTPAPSATSAAASNPAEQSAAPTALDPCELVTAEEASALAGTTFGAGKKDTTTGGAKTCVYGSQTTAVVQVLVAQAADASTAQADWAQELAEAEALAKQSVPAGLDFTFNPSDVSVAGADRAAVVSGKATFSGVTLGISAIYLLKGATFLTFSDLAVGSAVASSSTMEAQAVTSLGRVP